MPKIEFDIKDLYWKAFNYLGVPFPSQFYPARKKTNTESGKGIELGNSKIFELSQLYDVKSLLGTTYFMPVALDDQWLPNNPMMSVECRNNIVFTSIAGNERIGTVKETTGQSDYQITIRGFCFDFYEMDYPKDEVNLLHTLFKRKYVAIKNELTELFGIQNAVIETLKFPELGGKQNVQAYEMTLISDDDYTVLLEQ